METRPHHTSGRRATIKSGRIQLRVSDERRVRYETAAALEGKTLTEFVTAAVDLATEHALADRRSFVLDDEAWGKFNAMLDAPPKVLPGLVDLFSRQDVFEENS